MSKCFWSSGFSVKISMMGCERGFHLMLSGKNTRSCILVLLRMLPHCRTMCNSCVRLFKSSGARAHCSKISCPFVLCVFLCILIVWHNSCRVADSKSTATLIAVVRLAAVPSALAARKLASSPRSVPLCPNVSGLTHYFWSIVWWLMPLWYVRR